MSKSINFFWKVWLRLNFLTKDVDNDYTAEVSTIGNTVRNENIVDQIIGEGSEIKRETILSILNQSDRIIRNSIQQGKSVQTGYCHLTPRVLGAWLGASAKYDAKIHKLSVDMIPSAEMREALQEVGIEVLGVKDSGAFIGLVTDGSTGLTDGTITINEDIIIEGIKIKIAPDEDPNLGIFFVDPSENHYQVTHRLLQNDPKKIIARVPYMPSGEYKLHIVTRFSQGSVFLNEPRTIVYEKKLYVQ